MRTPNRLLRKAFLPAAILLTIALNGCTTAGGRTTSMQQYGAPPQTLLPGDINQFVSSQPAGSRSVFATSPWGSQVEIGLSATYFAASGRPCRELEVQPAATDADRSRLLACEVEANQWQAGRAVTRVLK